SFSSCWPKALQLSAALIPATSIRYRLHGHLRARAIAHDRRSGLLQIDFAKLPSKARNSAPSTGNYRGCYTANSTMWKGLLIRISPGAVLAMSPPSLGSSGPPRLVPSMRAHDPDQSSPACARYDAACFTARCAEPYQLICLLAQSWSANPVR